MRISETKSETTLPNQILESEPEIAVSEEKIADSTTEVAEHSIHPSPQISVERLTKPIATTQNARSNKFSINDLFKENEKESTELVTKEILNNAFSQDQLEAEWKKLLEKVKDSSIPAYNALHTAEISLQDNFCIELVFESASALSEFESVRQDWMEKLEKTFQNNCIQFQLKITENAVKSYVLSKEEILQKLIEKNSLVEDICRKLGLDI